MEESQQKTGSNPSTSQGQVPRQGTQPDGELMHGSEERFDNTNRDEGTLGRADQRYAERAGLADEDQPSWSPPETQPEPRPTEPVLNQPSNSSQSTNTNSPA
ncbi:MAG: hypothetical protein AB7G93_13840 [Bdellovibrionales bacterium]